MRPKALAAAAIMAALAVAAVGVRRLRPGGEAAPFLPPVSSVETAAPRAAPPPAAAPASPAPSGAAAAAAQPLAAAPDLAGAQVVEEVVSPRPAPAAPPAAPRPRLQPMPNMSGYMDGQAQGASAHYQYQITGAKSVDDVRAVTAAGNAVEKTANDLAAQAQALAFTMTGKPAPAAAAPAAAPAAAVQMQVLPSSTLGDFHYQVINVEAKAVDDVQIITPGKTWRLGRLAAGQSTEISTPDPLLQVKVHYVTAPQ